MDQPYDQPRTTTTTVGPTLHPEYARSREGIFKIIEIVLSLITFICSVVHYWEGHGWAEFVAMSAFFMTLIYLVFYLLDLISRFPGPWLLIEFIYYLVFALFFLIAAIVAAAKAVTWHPNVGATAFFAFAATIVYAIDAVFMFRAWQSGIVRITTTTSSATVEHGRTQY
jgi:hypothetical protein